MKNFKKKYEKLEKQVIKELRDKIENSTYISKHVNLQAIKVNVFNYTELTNINGALHFIDENGYHYFLFAECTLEDLVDILSKN